MKRSNGDKKSDYTQRWDIYITPAERLEITRGAAMANMSIRAFIMTRVRTAPRRDPTDWARGLQHLESVERKLDDIAANAAPDTALDTITALLSLERETRAMARPWTQQAQEPMADPQGVAS